MYLENAMELVTTDVAWSFSWANKTVGVQVSECCVCFIAIINYLIYSIRKENNYEL